jgi:UDP-N-acetylmuramate dehydrogenase
MLRLFDGRRKKSWYNVPIMNFQENVPLGPYSTMRLGGPARYLVDVTNRNEIEQALKWADDKQLPFIMIGGGSNIIWGDNGFPGLVMVNKVMRWEEYKQDEENLYITVGAGEDWDNTVKRTAEMGFSGIEQLSLIPGTAGATPIQNVGAYGREIKDVLVTVEAYDIQAKKFINLRNEECEFSYRMSRFKSKDKGRFFISAITLHLTKTNPQPPFYSALQKYFEENNITRPTPQIIRGAVIAIRSAKLPDPSQVANNGSFFYNPIIPMIQAQQLLEANPGLQYWSVDDDKAKISAAWLVENTGFKGVHDQETGMATWEKQPLVLVNEHAQNTANLLQFKKKIVDAVKTKYGITLEQEPELIDIA